jgi:hypothetical protein
MQLEKENSVGDPISTTNEFDLKINKETKSKYSVSVTVFRKYVQRN